jgi:hypothetical protein
MPLEATAVAYRSGTNSAPLIRRKRIDGRTKTARRIAELLADYASRLHLPSTKVKPTIHATALRLAELETLAETQRAAALRGEAVDLDGLVRLENAARRLKVDLGLEGPPPPPPLPATLAEMMDE